MRVDAHHTFLLSGHAVQQLWPILERNGFEGSVLIQPEPSDELTDRALEAAGEQSFIKALSAWVDLESPQLGKRLDLLQRNSPKLRGIFTTLADPGDLSEIARRGLAIDMLLQPKQLGRIDAIMDRFPGVPVIIDHLGNPAPSGGDFEFWALQVEKLAQIPSVAIKISGLLRLNHPARWSARDLKPFVQHAITCFGPDRLLFGSGWPDSLAGGSWKESLAAFTQSIGPHSIDVREKLLGGTAARLYKFLT